MQQITSTADQKGKPETGGSSGSQSGICLRWSQKGRNRSRQRRRSRTAGRVSDSGQGLRTMPCCSLHDVIASTTTAAGRRLRGPATCTTRTMGWNQVTPSSTVATGAPLRLTDQIRLAPELISWP